MPLPKVCCCHWWFEDQNGNLVHWKSSDHSWAEVPDDGFQARLICYDNGTFRRDSGLDFYWEAPHASGQIIYGSSNQTQRTVEQTLAEIQRRYPGAVIKRGRFVPDEVAHEVERLVTEEQEKTRSAGCKGC